MSYCYERSTASLVIPRRSLAMVVVFYFGLLLHSCCILPCTTAAKIAIATNLHRGGSSSSDHVLSAAAVGDPDDDSSSDDDGEEDEEFLFSDLDEDPGVLSSTMEQVQVDVEYDIEQVDEVEEEEYEEHDDEESSNKEGRRKTGRVRKLLQNRFQRNPTPEASILPETFYWESQVFYPPTNHSFITDHHRRVEADARLRLDRRTLYAGLLAELSRMTSSTQRRNYLATDTAHELTAAAAVAFQPSWRNKTGTKNTSMLRLYGGNAPTSLAMQETIAMALAHSMGAAFLVLDDEIVQSVAGSSKPAVALRALFQSELEPSVSKGSTVSAQMWKDLQDLDDPFDDKAKASYETMIEWEKDYWNTTVTHDVSSDLPMVVFFRTSRCKQLLRSKSVMDLLIEECQSTSSRNLIVLGNGIDSATTSLPREFHETAMEAQQQQQQQQQQIPQGPNFGQIPGAQAFGFTPHNPNASGQNDPPGSRRFNIFLARTVDEDGKPGIVGAVAPPEAGNLFPHMMAMQAQSQQQSSPDFERWAKLLQHQIESNSNHAMPPPQFFNATLSRSDSSNLPAPSPDMIQQTLEQAVAELLDRIAELNDNGSDDTMPPELQKAFSQILRHEGLRRGISENLARAVPALSDPKCQGVLLSVLVPQPEPLRPNNDKASSQSSSSPAARQPGWFRKPIDTNESDDTPAGRNKRTRTMAAAAAMMAAEQANKAKKQDRSERNLVRLESISRPVIVETPSDPVRAKAWQAWIGRERGSVVFRQNRRLLNEALDRHVLTLQEHTGTRGAGSSLRQMLSVRPMDEEEMRQVIERSIELEATKAQRSHEERGHMDACLGVDVTLNQLLLTEDGLVSTTEVFDSENGLACTDEVHFIHPSSLENALASVCGISPSPVGAFTVGKSTAAYRSRDEIASLAQDKHERALVSQVVSPQDIGVTYDMVGGLSQVKELLRQSITYPLKFPHLYSEGIAREAVKGVLLFGPPGTGKTMLAKAVATEGGASFLSVDASSVENKWLGESEKNAKAVFTLARRLAPCVIFIDEVDSLLSSREGSSDDSAHGTLTSVKTTMMSEWDGLNSGTNGVGEAGSDRVIVIGSTNRPFDLDEAVLRRFPRRILVDLPDLETRQEILEVTLAENRLDPSVNLTSIAERLDGYTGSDIKEVCREAVVQISHEQAKMLDQGTDESLDDDAESSLQRLRPVTVDDFDKALGKLKRSVAENGREIARVWEWNDQYGEIKKDRRDQLSHLASMYL